MRGVIDRFEEELAVIEVEDGSTVEVPRSRLPKKSKPGDAVIINGDTVRMDPVETKRRRKEIESLMDELFE